MDEEVSLYRRKAWIKMDKRMLASDSDWIARFGELNNHKYYCTRGFYSCPHAARTR